MYMSMYTYVLYLYPIYTLTLYILYYVTYTHVYTEVKQDATELLETGRTDIALDVLAQKGDWERVWEIVARESVASAVVSKFVIMRINEVCIVCSVLLFTDYVSYI